MQPLDAFKVFAVARQQYAVLPKTNACNQTVGDADVRASSEQEPAYAAREFSCARVEWKDFQRLEQRPHVLFGTCCARALPELEGSDHRSAESAR